MVTLKPTNVPWHYVSGGILKPQSGLWGSNCSSRGPAMSSVSGWWSDRGLPYLNIATMPIQLVWLVLCTFTLSGTITALLVRAE